MDHHSLAYGGRLHCPLCGGDDPIEAEEAWWEGDDLHLRYEDGTETVIKDAQQYGYTKESVDGDHD